jgi:hypothetical protein
MNALEYESESLKFEQQIEELLGLNQDLENRNQELKTRNQELEQELKRLRELLNAKGESKAPKKPKFRLKYSLEKHQVKGKHRHQSTGSETQARKQALVTNTQDIYPSSVCQEACEPHREQYAWRIIGGKAEYICYTIYDRLDSKTLLPTIPRLRNSRSEYGVEIILIVVFLHYLDRDFIRSCLRCTAFF